MPSVRFVWKKNPDYYMKDRPFIDRIEVPIVPEYATRLAQFKAGNIHTDVMGGNGGGQGDIVPTKKRPAADRWSRSRPSPRRRPGWCTFGYEGNSPFKDQRMRQAASMLIDREGYIDVIDNRDGFRKDGLDLEVVYNSIVSAGCTGFWIDPKDEKNFGPTAKYLKLQHRRGEEADRRGRERRVSSTSTTTPARTFPVQAQGRRALQRDVPRRRPQAQAQRHHQRRPVPDDYDYGYLSPGYANGTKKGYSGVTMGQERPYATIALMVFGSLHKDGAFYKGMSPTGINVKDGDPKVNDLAQKIKREFDVEKQKTLTHELIRYFTGQTYYIPVPSQVKGLSAYWPAIGNLNVFSNGVSPNVWTERHLNWWIDTSKAPFV